MTPGGRAYTVQELDELRAVIANKLLWGRYGAPEPNTWGTQYRDDELAGHTAEDLLASERETAPAA